MTQKIPINSVEREHIQAEARATEFIKQRHSKVERILFRTTYRDGDNWLLCGEVKFKRAYLFTATKFFKLKVDRDKGEVTFYEEASVPT